MAAGDALCCTRERHLPIASEDFDKGQLRDAKP